MEIAANPDAPGRPAPRRGRRRRQLLGVVASLVVVAAVGFLTLHTGAARLASAEERRLAERSSLVASLTELHSFLYDPVRVHETVVDTPFSPDDDGLNALLLQQYRVTPVGDPNAVVALVDAGGTVRASLPAGALVPVEDLGDAWPAALDGRPAVSNVFRYGGDVARASAVPVGEPRPWAVLVSVQRTIDSLGQAFDERLGTLGSDPGGLSELNADGVAVASWDPALVGTRLVDPADLGDLRPGEVRVTTSGSGAGEVTTIAARQHSTGHIGLFRQDSATLYGDLRAAQHRRDRSVVLVLSASLVGFLAFSALRARAARHAEARARTLLRNGRDLVLVAGGDGTLHFVSPVLGDLLGHDPRRWQGRRIQDLVHGDDAERVAGLVAAPEEGTAVALNVRIPDAGGSVRWFDLQASDRSAVPDVGGVVVTCHPTDDRKRLQDELSHQADHDALTGLPNRSAFTARLDAALADGRDPRTRIAVLFLDLDRFKPVNDRFGHDAGDHLLRTVARRFHAAVRDGDAVCRFGGDEFAVLLHRTDADAARAVGDRLIEAARAPVTWGTSLVAVDASVGIALAHPGSAHADELLRRADAAMYAAKQSGRGGCVVDDRAPRMPAATAPGPGPATRGEVAAVPPARSGPAASPPADAGAGAWSGTGRRARWLAGSVPLVVAAALLAGLAGFRLWRDADAAAAAEAHRLAERQRLAERVATWVTEFGDPARLTEVAAEAPWMLDDGLVDRLILRSFAASPAAGPGSVVVLAGLDGRPIASEPDGVAPALRPSDPTWEAALAGGGALSPVVDDGGTLRRFYAVPVLRDGDPVAMLLVGPSLTDSLLQRLTQISGSLGLGDGGLLGVDDAGVAWAAWDPGVLGTGVLDPAVLAGGAEAAAREVAAEAGQVTIAARLGDGGHLVLQQPDEAFYGDLRRLRTAEERWVSLVVAAAVLVLAASNRRRVAAARRSEARLQALLQHSHDIVLAFGPDGRAVLVSSAIETLLGHTRRQWDTAALASLVHPDDAARVGEALAAGFAGRAVEVRDVRVRGADGDHRWFDVDVSAAGGGRRPLVTVTCHAIGERKALEDDLAHASTHDALTGLPSRSVFAAELGRVAEAGARDYGLLFVDLDHFKPINDRFGHDVGDRALQVVAGRLSGAVRDGDLVSRVGGDEFVVLLRQVDEGRARDAAARVLAAIRAPMTVDGATLSVDATIGVALGTMAADHPETALRLADRAMYQAKAAGRGRYAVFSA